MNSREINLHDTHIGLWTDDFFGPKNPRTGQYSLGPGPFGWEMFNRICDELARLGFAVRRDEYFEDHYKILAKYHRRGTWKGLEAGIEVHGRRLQLEFWQDVVTEKPNGGRYDFSKRSRMPYLIGKRFELARQRIIALVERHGFVINEHSKPKPEWHEDPLGAYNARIGWHDSPRGPDGWPAKLNDYNSTDADGVVMRPGDLRYMRDYQGYLWQVRVYPCLNNMWKATTSGQTFHVANFNLFTCDPLAVPRKLHQDRERRLRELERQAVADRDYRRAEGIVRALKSEAA